MSAPKPLALLREKINIQPPEISYCNAHDPLPKRMLVRAIERATGQPKLQRLYDAYKASGGAEDDFWAAAVHWLDLSVNFDAERLAAIPKTGPVVVLANHPYGVLDGIAAGYLISRVRSDIKLMAHASLGKTGDLLPYLIPVEFDGMSSALRANVDSKRKAMAHLKEGGLLLIFPAGSVSTARRVFDRAVDAPWKLFAGKLVATSSATVVPMYFEGQNSWLFQLASLIHKGLREPILLGEVVKQMGGEISARIGSPIDFDSLSHWNDRQALLDHLRDMVYALDPAKVGLSNSVRAVNE